MARTVLLHFSMTYTNQKSWKPIRFETFVIVMMGKLKKAVILSDKDVAKLIKTYSQYVFRLTFIPVQSTDSSSRLITWKWKTTVNVWQFDRHYLYIHAG